MPCTMKQRVLVALILGTVFITLVLPTGSCNDTTAPNPAPVAQPDPNRDQIVTFKLTSAKSHGNCDDLDCEVSGSGGNDFHGDVYVQLDESTKIKIWDVDWENASGTKELNKTHSFTVKKGQKVTAFSEGLREDDSLSRDEGLSDFSKVFFHPIKNYTDLRFDCIHGDPNNSNSCYCCLELYWTIEAKYVDTGVLEESP
jgi:hypothetical protein